MRYLKIVLLVGVCCLAAMPAAGQMSLWVSSYQALLPAVNSNYGWFLAGPLDGYYGPAPANINGVDVGPLYCIDLNHEILTDPAQFDVVDNVNTVGGFYDQPDRTGDLSQVAWLVNNYGGQMTNPYLQGSMQVAIWSILYPTYQYYGGLTDVAELNFLKSVSAGQHATHYRWFDYQGPDPGGQDLIQSVPEPASLILLGTGLVGLAFIRRRRS